MPLKLILSSSFALVCACLAANSVDAQTAVPKAPPVLLQMIRDDSVHNELKLSKDQITRVRSAHESVDADWFRTRVMADPKQATEIIALTEKLRQRLAPILSAEQTKRLQQLERQALGTRMLVSPSVASALGISEAKHKQFVTRFIETDRKAAEIQKKLRASELKGDEAQKKMTELQNDERQLFANDLTREQQSKISGITGERFDFSQVKRMYPLAPALTTDGVTWIQGGPIKLDDLKGKVVAVHFYAFQCINCKRNLPHYKAWHEDYADKGLVVIGIQTPETPAERMLNRVRDAAKSNQIDYPVMLDSSSSNWKAWSTTMWPTVYLIDKQGFIRRWWQGEMNWQGTPGEEQMRKTIEQLLAETD